MTKKNFNIVLFLSKKLPAPTFIKKFLMDIVLRGQHENELGLMNGLAIVGDIRDMGMLEIYSTGGYEPIITSLFHYFVKDRDTVFDIGANIGYFSIIASHLTGPMGKCYAFEPIPGNAHFIQKNKDLNSLDQLVVVNKCVGNLDSRRMKLYVSSVLNSGSNTVVGSDHHKNSIHAESITLDSFCTSQNITSVDFLKMDIEGSECYAIEGMRQGIQKHLYKKVMIEFHDKYLEKLGVTSYDLKKVFVESNYRAFEVMPPNHLIDRTKTGLQGGYMVFISPDQSPFNSDQSVIDFPLIKQQECVVA